MSAAVSRGSDRPTRLNGSWTLSAPAATRAPHSWRAATAVRPRGVPVGWSRPWRNRLVWGSGKTAMPASATSPATSSWTLGGCMPRVTQWLAATSPPNPESITCRASSRRVSTDGSSISSTWRSMPIPASAASAIALRMSAGPSGSRWGHPPTKSTPSSTAASRAARLPAPSAPVTGLLVSATVWTSRRPSKRPAASFTARSAVVPLDSITFTWVRTTVTPWTSSSSIAAAARSTVPS